MGYQHRVFTEEVKAKFEAEGRGIAEGKEWRPWYQLGDLSAHFRDDNRFTCLYTKRPVYLSTFLARLCWHALELEDDTVEILECAPLDRTTTQRIAKTLGIPHPKDPDSLVDLVMTTSLIAKKQLDGKTLRTPIHCCPRAALEKFSNIEEIQIQAAYWRLHGQELRVFTGCELSIHPQWKSNIDTLDAYRLPSPDPDGEPGRFANQCERVLEMLLQSKTDIALDRWAYDAAPRLQMTTPEVIERLLHLVCRLRVRLDLAAGPVMHQTTAAALSSTQPSRAQPTLRTA